MGIRKSIIHIIFKKIFIKACWCFLLIVVTGLPALNNLKNRDFGTIFNQKNDFHRPARLLQTYWKPWMTCMVCYLNWALDEHYNHTHPMNDGFTWPLWVVRLGKPYHRNILFKIDTLNLMTRKTNDYFNAQYFTTIEI